MSGHPSWYLPVGERLDQARAELLVATFRNEVVRVGRALRRRMEGYREGVVVGGDRRARLRD